MNKIIKISLLTVFFLLFSSQAFAGAKNKVVIQVSTNDPTTQKIALNNAVNLQKALGIDKVTRKPAKSLF